MITLDSLHHTTLGELLTAQASRYAGRTFLVLGDERWTYAEAERQANALAASLRGLGLQPGDRLSIILPNLPAYVLAIFAAAKAGLIVTPINVRRKKDEVLARLGKTRPSALITDAEHLPMMQELRAGFPALEHLITVDSPAEDVIAWRDLLAAGAKAAPLTPMAQPGDPAAILYTLGNSGAPRGATLTHGALVRNAAGIAATLAATPDDVFLGAVPFSNAFGLTPTILACAVAGAQLAPLPFYHAGDALALIEQAGVTVHHGTPTMFALELNHPGFRAEACASLRTGVMSGAPCPPELVTRVREQMNCNLILAYGLTEASPSVTMTHLDDGPVTATQTVGRPMAGVSLKVIGPDGETLPDGAEGELCVRGYNLMTGYWEDPDATAQMLGADGWLHTGDLAVLDPDGPVKIVGRKDDVINRGGFKIYPGTVEMVLRSYPGVKEAAVVGVPDAIFGELPCACVVRAPGADFTPEQLLAFAAERLGDYAVPSRALFFDALPRRGSGPVRKDLLRERVRIRGKAWKFGKNIDTDAIIPARHCNTSDPRELAQHCMEDADPSFVKRMRRGDVIVADTNFGCGSSREVAPISLKAAGVSAVIAKSFARIFFRNSINIGLAILECPAAVDGIAAGDEIEVEPATGTIRNLTRDETYRAEPFPDFLQRIIDRGGLLAYVEERLAAADSGWPMADSR
ncbi:MAG TPA: AMP-binding protein [Anaerolineales bacterium]|nr:AMP-binding protein [Anaerolineales bacterium]